jgi:hypothetical protein
MDNTFHPLRRAFLASDVIKHFRFESTEDRTKCTGQIAISRNAINRIEHRIRRQAGFPGAFATPQRGQLDYCRCAQASRSAGHQCHLAVDETQDDPILASASSISGASADHTQTCQLVGRANPRK